MLAFNLMGSTDPKEGMLPSILATLSEQFRTVRVQPAGVQADAVWGNYVVLASDDRQSTLARRTPARYTSGCRRPRAASVPRPNSMDWRCPLTDDFNP